MKKKIALSLCLAIAPTLITLLSSLAPSLTPSFLRSFIPSSLIAQIPADGLVAWYPFNGNANDESGNGHNGTVNGATLTIDRNGIANSSYSFNGVSNFIGLQGTEGIDFSSGATFSAWINADELRMASIVDKEEYCSSQGYRINVRSNGDVWAEHACYGAQISGANTAMALSSYSPGVWYHIVGTIDLNNGNRIYVNGIEKDVKTIGLNINNSKMIQIAKATLDQGEFFKGKIDDVIIYNRSLSSSEIQQLYQDQTGQVQQPLTCSITAPVTTICEGESVTLSVNTTGGAGSSSQLPANLQQGLVAYYPFNGNANDESGNGIDGIANGATLIADRFGNSNSAYSFDGVDDYISFPNSNTIGITSFSGITISLWFQVNLVENIRIFHFFNQTLDLTIHNSSLGAVHCANYNSAGGGFNFLQIATPPSNQLVHFTWSLDFISNTASVYLDGMLHNQISIPGAILSSDMMYEIGTANGWILNGSVDDVAIFSRALTPSEIQQLYTSQSFAWNTDETSNTITVAPTTNTNYSCTVTQGNSTCTASVDIVVNPVVTNTISASIVEGQSYTLGTQTLTTAGTYTEVFTSTAGCDSTVTLTLSVEPLLTCNITAPTTALCAGESVNLSVSANGGSEITPNLTNLMFLTNYEGHDYYLYTDFLSWEAAKAYGDQNGLSMYIVNSAAEANAIYQTLPFIGVDNVHYWMGLYQDLNDPSYSEPSGAWKWVDGTYLTGYSNWAAGEPNDASPGEHYAQFEWSNYGLQWNDAGFPAQNGTQFSLTIYELGGGNLTNANFSWSTNATDPSISVSPTANTTYSCTVTSGSQTCTATVDIAVNPAVTNAISASIVEGQSYTLGNQTLTTAGTYTEVFTSSTGCDSTVTLTLSVEPLLTCNITAPVTTICAGESVTLSVNTTGSAGSSSQLPANLQDGLVAYYPFNGNANDESGNGDNLMSNGPVLGNDYNSTPNSAMSFNGVYPNYLYSSNGYLNLVNTSLTVSAWIYPNSQNVGLTSIISKVSNTTTNIYGSYGLSLESGIVKFTLANVNGQPYWYNQCNSPNAVTNNEWHHILGVANKLTNVMELYVDGVLVASNSWFGQLHNGSNQKFFIGASYKSNFSTQYVYHFNGKIDEVTVHNRALSPSEIQQLYFAQSYAWNTGETTNSITVTPTTNTTYSCTVTQGNSTCTASVDITVHPAVNNAISASIVEGQSFTLGAQTLTTAGTYTEVFTSTAGCDSTVTLTLSVLPNLNIISSDTIYTCAGAEVNIQVNTSTGQTILEDVNSNIVVSVNAPTLQWGPMNDISTNAFSTSDGSVNTSLIVATLGNYNSGNYAANYCYTSTEGGFSDWYLPSWQELSGMLCPNSANIPGWQYPGYYWSSTETDNPNWAYLAYSAGSQNCGSVAAPHKTGQSMVRCIRRQDKPQIQWPNGSNGGTYNLTANASTVVHFSVNWYDQTYQDSVVVIVLDQQNYYDDADGDGFGNPNSVVQDCNQPAGYVTDNTDCNDAVTSSFPGGEEICGNNIDEDCNGLDSICFVAVLGCTNPNACNFNLLANTDDNSCVLPQPEICDGLDNNCNNQIDEGFTIPTINPVAVTPALYPVCTGNALKSADFNNGTNSPIIAGNGPDLWYSFTAEFNTLRVGLSAAFGDNSIGLYTLNSGCLELLTEEHEVYTATTLATGNQILLSDQLTVGQTYYVAVHQITGPTNTSAKVCFTYLNGSACDHYYSNNTGVYTSVCNSFKAQYRANATNYIFNVLSGTQNGVNMNLTPWTYTNNNANSVVARLGSILPANHSGANRVYTLAVPVVYGLTDAAGNVSNLLANATTTCTVTLNSEATIALRQADRCPAAKSITGTIAPDRSVCGALRYDWEFTEVLPNPGSAQVVQGGAYASVFFLSNVPGVAAGKTYNVRVRPVHSSGNAGSWGAVNCLRIGNAGMVLDNHPVRTPLLSLRAGGEMNASYSIYPNPTATGSFVLQYNGSRRGESIFAQEPTTTESNSAQESTTTESNSAQEPTTTESTQELRMMDFTGKVVYQQQVVLNGNSVEIQFGELASGVYVVMVGEERMRLIID